MVLTVLLDPYGKKEYDETVVEHRSVHLNFSLLTDVEKYLQKQIYLNGRNQFLKSDHIFKFSSMYL